MKAQEQSAGTTTTTKKVVETVVSEKIGAASTQSAVGGQPLERKKVSQPSGKLATNNIGIKATLNPRQKKKDAMSDSILEERNEEYTIEQLQRVWKEYALGVKRENKDSLYATLMQSDLHVDSSHVIHLKIKNSVQSTELDEEKGSLVRFLRVKLKNTNINLNYELDEQKKVEVLDSKTKFEKLAEENQSLHKFRKLFNLDIEF